MATLQPCIQPRCENKVEMSPGVTCRHLEGYPAGCVYPKVVSWD